MNWEWLVVVIIMLVMNAFLLLVFWTARQRAEFQIRGLFYEKLEDVNLLAKQRLEELERTERRLREQQERLDRLCTRQNERAQVYQRAGAGALPPGSAVSMKTVHYRNTEAMEQYRYIRDRLDMDPNRIVREVMAELEDLKQEHLLYRGLADKFPFEVRYQLLTLPGEQQLQVFSQVLTEDEREILEQYQELHGEQSGTFDVLDFFDYVENGARERDGTIWVYTADRRNPLDIQDERVKWKHCPDIYEGCRIQYKDCVYDYSL